MSRYGSFPILLILEMPAGARLRGPCAQRFYLNCLCRTCTYKLIVHYSYCANPRGARGVWGMSSSSGAI